MGAPLWMSDEHHVPLQPTASRLLFLTSSITA